MQGRKTGVALKMIPLSSLTHFSNLDSFPTEPSKKFVKSGCICFLINAFSHLIFSTEYQGRIQDLFQCKNIE